MQALGYTIAFLRQQREQDLRSFQLLKLRGIANQRGLSATINGDKLTIRIDSYNPETKEHTSKWLGVSNLRELEDAIK